MVMLFASYEKLLRSTCISLLETAASLRVKNSRLHPGLQLFAVYPKLEGLIDAGKKSIWTTHGPAIVSRLGSGDCSEIAASLFPNDGSFMRQSQVELFSNMFGLPHPGGVLLEVWQRLDQVVRDRNAVAHGDETAEQVGRRYTEDEMLALVYFWHLRWGDFVDDVETRGAQRGFYRRD
jgi:hypothetical protein